MVWVFTAKQGYQVRDSICYQNNQITAKFENNGRESSSKKTHHVNVQYFLVTNRIKSGETKIEYFPTLDMIGDYFTNTLQGVLLQNLHNLILGIEEANFTKYNTKAD